MGLSHSDSTNGRDEQIMVIANGKGDTQSSTDFIYHAEVTDGYELRVTMNADSSSISVEKGTPQHFNGTVGTTAITITPASTTTSILVDNPNSNLANRTLQVSFDGGTNFFTIIRGAALAIDTEVSSFLIKASVTGTSYQILVTRK